MIIILYKMVSFIYKMKNFYFTFYYYKSFFFIILYIYNIYVQSLIRKNFLSEKIFYLKKFYYINNYLNNFNTKYKKLYTLKNV